MQWCPAEAVSSQTPNALAVAEPRPPLQGSVGGCRATVGRGSPQRPQRLGQLLQCCRLVMVALPWEGVGLARSQLLSQLQCNATYSRRRGTWWHVDLSLRSERSHRFQNTHAAVPAAFNRCDMNHASRQAAHSAGSSHRPDVTR